MCNLKNNTNELTYKNRNRLTDIGNKLKKRKRIPHRHHGHTQLFLSHWSCPENPNFGFYGEPTGKCRDQGKEGSFS